MGMEMIERLISQERERTVHIVVDPDGTVDIYFHSMEEDELVALDSDPDELVNAPFDDEGVWSTVAVVVEPRTIQTIDDCWDEVNTVCRTIGGDHIKIKEGRSCIKFGYQGLLHLREADFPLAVVDDSLRTPRETMQP